MSKSVPLTLAVFLAAFLSGPVAAQTFSAHQSTAPAASAKPGKKGSKAPAPHAGGGKSLGWGSNIKIARLAKAAEMALRKGRYTEAMNYAQNAANAAPQDQRLWFLYGYCARMAGKSGVSVQAYQRGLQVAPNDVEGLSGLAQTYMKMGRPDAAKPLLMRVLAANPKRPNDLVMAGELFMQSGDYQQALVFLQRAEAIKPAPRSELLSALCYVHMKQPQKAKALLEKAQKRSPGNPEVLRAVAGFYRETGDYPAAIAALKKITKPKADVLGELGYTYQLAGNKAESAKTYVKAADADQKHIGLQLSAAQAMINIDQPDKAQRFLKRAEAIDANSYRLHALRGDLARANGDPMVAAREYEAALANIAPAIPEGPLFPVHLRMSLYAIDSELGRQTDAEQQLAQARQAINAFQKPDDPNFLRLRGEIRLVSKDYEGALADIKQAVALQPKNPEFLGLYGTVLWRLNKTPEATAAFQQALALDPKNRSALSSLGYLARGAGKRDEAEKYFRELAAAYPKDYTPYLALGDMFTEQRKFDQGLGAYEKAYKLAPNNALIIAGGANAGIESKRFPVAKAWLDRAHGAMNDVPDVMKERERYLTWTGDYRAAAAIGQQVVKKMPKDRDVIVYLGYDLLYLGRYDDLLRHVSAYESVLPKEPDLPLLAGYAHKYGRLLDQAADDFGQALALNPKIPTAYVNRGYVYNDLQDPKAAIADFSQALALQPKNGEARLGIANSYLQLHQYRSALEQVDLATQLTGENYNTHLARATAYRGEGLFAKAEAEYRETLNSPQAQAQNDGTLQVALGEVLFRERKYQDSVATLQDALRIDPDDPFVYAKIADDYARMKDRDNTLRYIELAEKTGDYSSPVLLAAGDALLDLGDEDAARQHFEKALVAPDADRVQVRLSFARLMVQKDELGDAREQVGLAFAEARVGESTGITADHLLQAASLMLKIRDFDMAERLFKRALKEGAAEEVVGLGLANLYVAKGQPQEAQAALGGAVGSGAYSDAYDFELVQGQIYRQERDNLRALTAFARAATDAGEDDTARQAELDVAGEEGWRITPRLSLLSTFSVNPLFESPTEFVLDSLETNANSGGTGGFVPSRHQLEKRWTTAYRVHQHGLPTISGFVEYRNATGDVSVPAIDKVFHVNTTDLSFAGGFSPVVHLGSAVFNIDGGVQYTIRRDANLPFAVNQNLLRPYFYISSNTLFNWISFQGFGAYETGPFTNRLIIGTTHLSSRDAVARIDFRVGRPWAHDALVTGYYVRDIQFDPLFRERFATSSYVGWEHEFSDKLKIRGVGEYIRAWRVHDNQFFTAQMMRPAFSFDYQPSYKWRVEGSFAYGRGETYHQYDNMHAEFLMTYTKPWGHTIDGGDGPTNVQYPLRFSFGVATEDFFGTAGRSTFAPIVRLTVF
jgi:tetratricopeptide (TPR) repeat protein